MKFLLRFVLVVCMILVPAFTQAQGLVVCDGTAANPCDFCALGVLTNNIINWLFGFMTLVAVLTFAYAGFQLVTSGGDTDARDAAKRRFMYVIIGFLIMLASWLIVDTVLKGLTGGEGMEIWGSFDVSECGTAVIPEERSYGELNFDFNRQVTDFASDTVVQQSTQAAISDYNLFLAAGLVPPSPAGQLCYPSGVCFNTVSGVTNAYPGYDYPSGMSGPSEYIDLGAVNFSTRVSNSFTLGEVTRTSCRGKYAYVSPRAVAGLQAVRDQVGALQINSGYRSPICNRQVGGAARSQHMLGTAFDIQPPAGVSRQTIIDACKAAGSTFQQTYTSLSHVHCDWR